MSFKNLKTNRAAAISKLVTAAEGVTNTKKSYGDDRVWKPTRDKAGNGYAVIRFLPAKDGEDLPWVRYWDHGFKGPTGQWYIERSLTSVDQPDPVSEANSILWNSGNDEDKAVARDRKRRLHYVSNILVVNDAANPENEGKVFLYQFGKKIFDKIMDVMQPQFDDETPVNPYDFWEGADFKIKIRKVEGWVNYDKSEFATPAPLFGGDDDRIEAVYNKLHPLSEYTDPTSSGYKTYAELSAKLNRVLGVDAGVTAARVTTTPVVEAPTVASEEFTAPTVDNGDEDTMSYFAKLAQE
jgi:hypothetical protein